VDHNVVKQRNLNKQIECLLGTPADHFAWSPLVLCSCRETVCPSLWARKLSNFFTWQLWQPGESC